MTEKTTNKTGANPTGKGQASVMLRSLNKRSVDLLWVMLQNLHTEMTVAELQAWIADRVSPWVKRDWANQGLM